MADLHLPQDMIASFREVCAVDEAKARQYLVHCDGNLEDAVQLFFSTGGSLQNSYEGQHNEENARREQQNQQRNRRRAVAPANARSSSWWDTIITLISLPFRFTITTLYDLVGFIFEIFGPRRAALTDPAGDVARFISAYNENLAVDTPNRIDFFSGSYDDALRFAKTNLRMLLLYVHHPNNKDSAQFINNVLHSDQMKELVRGQDLIVFGVATSSPQGRAVAQMIQSSGEPILGLITFRHSTPIVALRLSGIYDPDAVVANLRLACDDYQAQLNQLRMEKALREENQRIREEQEREYRESVAKDRARIQERRRLESERAEAEELEKRKQQETDNRKTFLESRREEIRAAETAELTGDDLVRIQIRFPSGARMDRKFKPTDSLEALFKAAFSHEKCPIYFTVFTNFPRKEIHCAPNWYHDIRAAQLRDDGVDVPDFVAMRTFHDEGLDRSCVVMIQDCLA